MRGPQRCRPSPTTPSSTGPSRPSGGVATIFVTDDKGIFVRRTTNLKKENGDRAVGTALAPEHPAQTPLKAAQPYYGPATLFGRSFYTAYHPVLDSAGKVIGVLFIGIRPSSSTPRPANRHRQVGALALIVLLLGLVAAFVVRPGGPSWLQRPPRSNVSRPATSKPPSPPMTAGRDRDLSRALVVLRDNARRPRPRRPTDWPKWKSAQHAAAGWRPPSSATRRPWPSASARRTTRCATSIPVRAR